MRAAARVEIVRRDGRDVLADVRSEPPLAVRAAEDRVLLVGSAAAPVGGDELALDVVVGPGARLSLGTVAATIAWPGPTGAPSVQTLRVHVGAGGHVTWAPEPLVAVAGCRHTTSTEIVLGPGATASMIEEVALGRTGEVPGTVEMTWRIERDGHPLAHHTEVLGPGTPGWGSAAAVSSHRHLLTAVTVGSPAPAACPVVAADIATAVLAVADDASVVLAVGRDRAAVRRACATVLPETAPAHSRSDHPTLWP